MLADVKQRPVQQAHVHRFKSERVVLVRNRERRNCRGRC
jgi:hypothetical protein